MTKIVAFSFGRKQSGRCPNKMLRPFASTTLTDIVLSKLKSLNVDTFFAGYEDEFRLKCVAKGVRFVQRDERSTSIDGPITEILSFLRGVDATHFLLISSCCPLLGLGDIDFFLRQCANSGYKPAISVKTHRKHFLTHERQAVNFSLNQKTLNTKQLQPVLELVDALYFFEKEFFFREGTYWRWDEVQFLEVGDDQPLPDVDTETDFIVAETLWKNHATPAHGLEQ